MRVPAVALVFIGLLFAAAVCPLGGSIPTAAGATSDADVSETIHIDVQEDGDAHITVIKQLPVGTDAERDAFRQVREEFERGNHDIGGDRIIAVVDDVRAVTEREMTIRDQRRTGNLTTSTGTLRHEFTWTAFAATPDGRIEVGDVFSATGYNWIGTLGPDQQLVIEGPDEYLIASTTHPATDGRIVWNGPTTFTDEDIQITFERSALQPVVNVNPWIALAALLVVGLALSVLWRRSTDGTDEDSSPPAPPATTEKAAEASPEDTTDPDPVDPELLSDEERVERLLKNNGGRMKQSTIVEETGWSSAKVSQVLSKMDDEEQVDKLRIGRENLITLPEENVTDIE